jgi:HSP20 family protein
LPAHSRPSRHRIVRSAAGAAGRLTVEAERKQPEREKDTEVHLSERSYGTMRRAFTLPEDASADGIKATYRDGVLEVTVAKKPEAKPTRIKVNVGN